jgi:hypothetical protein
MPPVGLSARRHRIMDHIVVTGTPSTVTIPFKNLTASNTEESVEDHRRTSFVEDDDSELCGMAIAANEDCEGVIQVRLIGDEITSENHNFDLSKLIEGIINAVGSDALTQAISVVNERLSAEVNQD